MKRRNADDYRRRNKIASAILFLIAVLVTPSYALLEISPLKLYTIDMPGATGDVNKFISISNRYYLFAPFYPKEELDDSGGDDNHYVYFVDIKNPEGDPRRANLGNCYYPANMTYDPIRENVFVRATEYEQVDGGVQPIEVVAYFHVNFDGQPLDFDRTVKIRIEGRDTQYAVDAPVDFAVCHRGEILVYTNGHSVFTYNVITGNSYKVVSDNDPKNRIVFLDIDQDTNTLIIALNKEERDKGGDVRVLSELWFYSLESDGTINLLKRILNDGFPNGTGPTQGSNAAVSPTTRGGSNKLEADSAFFVTADGALCEVNLRGAGTDGEVEVLGVFPELAQEADKGAGPRLVKYDRAKRLLSVVKRGRTVRISRPSFIKVNGRRKISRPSFSRIEDTPALVLAQLHNKKNKIVRYKVFVDEFVDAVALTDLVAVGDAKWYASTYTGQLLSVDASSVEGVDKTELKPVGRIGSRVSHLEYNSARTSVLAINSSEMDEEGQRTVPGSLTIARLQFGGTKLANLSALQSSTTEPSSERRSSSRERCTSIRRPSF